MLLTLQQQPPQTGATPISFDHDEAYTNKHLVVLADQLKREELAEAPKDFIRNAALFPRVGIFALQHYDPFGLRQASDATLKERADTME